MDTLTINLTTSHVDVKTKERGNTLSPKKRMPSIITKQDVNDETICKIERLRPNPLLEQIIRHHEYLMEQIQGEYAANISRLKDTHQKELQELHFENSKEIDDLQKRIQAIHEENTLLKHELLVNRDESNAVRLSLLQSQEECRQLKRTLTEQLEKILNLEKAVYKSDLDHETKKEHYRSSNEVLSKGLNNLAGAGSRNAQVMTSLTMIEMDQRRQRDSDRIKELNNVIQSLTQEIECVRTELRDEQDRLFTSESLLGPLLEQQEQAEREASNLKRQLEEIKSTEASTINLNLSGGGDKSSQRIDQARIALQEKYDSLSLELQVVTNKLYKREEQLILLAEQNKSLQHQLQQYTNKRQR